MSASRVMHQTTIRFGRELWQQLETAAEEGGVSVAQYVREAAIERLVRSGALAGPDSAAPRDSASVLGGSSALTAQGRLVTSRSRKLRDEAQLGRTHNS